MLKTSSLEAGYAHLLGVEQWFSLERLCKRRRFSVSYSLAHLPDRSVLLLSGVILSQTKGCPHRKSAKIMTKNSHHRSMGKYISWETWVSVWKFRGYALWVERDFKFQPYVLPCWHGPQAVRFTLPLSSGKDTTISPCTQSFQGPPQCPCLKLQVSVWGAFLPPQNRCSHTLPWKAGPEVCHRPRTATVLAFLGCFHYFSKACCI